jgi:chromosome segregation ATPase
MILSMVEDNQLGKMVVSGSGSSTETTTPPKNSTLSSDAQCSSVNSEKDEDQEIEQKMRVMHQILNRKLEKAEEQKTILFQERASQRRSFNSLRRTLSCNSKSDIGDETTLEQMRNQLEALREEKEQVEEEIEKTQRRLEELTVIKETPDEKAKRLEELCNIVTTEFASQQKPTHEA